MSALSDEPILRHCSGEVALQYSRLQMTATVDPRMELTRAMPRAPSILKARPCSSANLRVRTVNESTPFASNCFQPESDDAGMPALIHAVHLRQTSLHGLCDIGPTHNAASALHRQDSTKILLLLPNIAYWYAYTCATESRVSISQIYLTFRSPPTAVNTASGCFHTNRHETNAILAMQCRAP